MVYIDEREEMEGEVMDRLGEREKAKMPIM